MATSSFSRFVVMVAGGTGTRMGTTTAKQFLIAAGKPIIVHTFERFRTAVPDAGFVLVLHHSLHGEWEAIRAKYLPWLTTENLIVCDGGKERSDSVKNGLEAILENGWTYPASKLLVLIHDAVRPMIDNATIFQSLMIADSKGNAVVCVPVKSSMRVKTSTGSKAVDRNFYYHVQTPQVFRFLDLLTWYRNKPEELFTDDASLAEFFGCDIQICEGGYDNLKITTPEDLEVAEILLRKEKMEEEKPFSIPGQEKGPFKTQNNKDAPIEGTDENSPG